MNSLILTLTLAVVISTVSATPPTVTTQYGQIRGTTVTVKLTNNPAQWTMGRKKRSLFTPKNRQMQVDTFFGIPFAKPPVGALRYEPPSPPNTFPTPLNATTPPAQCVPEFRLADNWQSMGYSEDCLYLNVFTPHNSNRKTYRPRLPVLVLIHGGGFILGSAQGYYNVTDLTNKFISAGIVVVSIQYRLGFLGFASLNTPSFNGNLGYWDQAMALKFIANNIAPFGGDPSQVTVMGYSAGGASTSALGLSPHTRTLFSRAVQMSGSVFAQWTTDSRVINATTQLAQLLNCTSSTKECLRSKSIDQVYDAINVMNPTRCDLNFIKFGPYIDGHFFPADYPTLIQQSPPKPTIIGFEQEDGLAFTLMADQNSSFSTYNVPASEYPTFSPSYINQFVKEVVARESDLGAVRAAQAQAEISAFYTNNVGNTPTPATYLQRYAQIVSDLLFIIPALTEVQLKVAAGWGNVHLYRNVYFSEQSVSTNPANPVKESYHNNAHMQIFGGFWIPPSPPTANDLAQMSYWLDKLVGFVRSGKVGGEWKAVSGGKVTRSMQVTQPVPAMVDQMMMDRLNFWNEVIRKYESVYNIMRGEP